MSGPSVSGLGRVWHRLSPIVGLALFVAAVAVLGREMRHMPPAKLAFALKQFPPGAIGLAMVFTALNYLILTGYDQLAFLYIRRPIARWQIAMASFVGYAIANNVGFALLSGTSARYRFYSRWGLSGQEISRVVLFYSGTFWLGLLVLGGWTLARGPALGLETFVPMWLARATGWVLLTTALAYPVVAIFRRRPLNIAGMQIAMPSLTLVTGQFVLSALDWSLAAAVLFSLLPEPRPDFVLFVGSFLAAQLIALVSHVPGGLGVFEAIMLVALHDRVPAKALAAALVLYRLIYYMLPLVLALALLVVQEARRGAATAVTRAAASLAPLLLAAYTFIIGLMLLISGVTPATDEATELLALRVPLPLVEASHFVGSIAGLGFLFVARGMLLRLDAAWWAGLLIGIVSMIACLPKGIAISEALLIGFLVLSLLLSRRQFTRPASLLAQPFSGGWLLSVVLIIMALTGLLFFVYRDVEYTQQLWWQFEFDGHAPRSLRALVAVAVLASALALRQLLRPPAARLAKPDPAELERAAKILERQSNADACVALMGDKNFLFSESGNAFVMFGRRGRSWVSLFDPVGPKSEWPELVWRFLERAREQGGRASFYQVRPQTLPVYLDAGLRVYKLGEYAYVDLPAFSLKGKARGDLRQALNRGEREQMSLEVLPPGHANLAELRAISDSWLAEHATAEKGFSLGAFADGYVQRCPVALVRQQGLPVAFATLMVTGVEEEASVDLMRQGRDAPNGTMDYLFAKLLLHFQALGYRRFGLGMAPLSGMAEHPLAPRWHRLGRLLFSHGEHFYNFQGLRAFKEKFGPEWEARYLAAPGGMTPLFVLADVAALISGGVRGLIAK